MRFGPGIAISATAAAAKTARWLLGHGRDHRVAGGLLARASSRTLMKASSGIELLVSLDRESPVALHLQLERQLRHAARTGRFGRARAPLDPRPGRRARRRARGRHRRLHAAGRGGLPRLQAGSPTRVAERAAVAPAPARPPSPPARRASTCARERPTSRSSRARPGRRARPGAQARARRAPGYPDLRGHPRAARALATTWGVSAASSRSPRRSSSPPAWRRGSRSSAARCGRRARAAWRWRIRDRADSRPDHGLRPRAAADSVDRDGIHVTGSTTPRRCSSRPRTSSRPASCSARPGGRG